MSLLDSFNSALGTIQDRVEGLIDESGLLDDVDSDDDNGYYQDSVASVTDVAATSTPQGQAVPRMLPFGTPQASIDPEEPPRRIPPARIRAAEKNIGVFPLGLRVVSVAVAARQRGTSP